MQTFRALAALHTGIYEYFNVYIKRSRRKYVADKATPNIENGTCNRKSYVRALLYDKKWIDEK